MPVGERVEHFAKVYVEAVRFFFISKQTYCRAVVALLDGHDVPNACIYVVAVVVGVRLVQREFGALGVDKGVVCEPLMGSVN